MKVMWKEVMVGIGVLFCSALAGATDLTIQLNGPQAISRNTVNPKGKSALSTQFGW
jgi:hypothetical protein